jgi:hypothetical protein
MKGVSKAMFYPQTPQGGLFEVTVNSKSPLGACLPAGRDLGVKHNQRTFETSS